MMDCINNIFGSSGIFGGGSGGSLSDEKLAEILNGYNILILAGDSKSQETLTKIDGGTALSKDLLSFDGGNSLIL